MKRTITCILLLLLLASSGGIMAKTKSGLGVHFGTVSANGFSYRQFTGKQGFQATLGAITYDDGEENLEPYYSAYYASNPSYISRFGEGKKTNLNAGLNYLYSLADNPSGRFYVFAGGAYLLSIAHGNRGIYYPVTGSPGNYQLDPGSVVKDTEYQHSFYLGGGMGFELNLGRGFRWALEMPLTINEDTEFTMYIPQTGLYYFF